MTFVPLSGSKKWSVKNRSGIYAVHIYHWDCCPTKDVLYWGEIAMVPTEGSFCIIWARETAADLEAGVLKCGFEGDWVVQ